MQINVTHTLTLSDDTKQFLMELLKPDSVKQPGIVGSDVNTTVLTGQHPPATPTSRRAPILPWPAGAAGTVEEPKAAEPKPNVKPPGIATTRIGGETAHAIKAMLPATLEVIAKGVKRKPADAADLLVLLWNRKEITFDGENYNVV